MSILSTILAVDPSLIRLLRNTKEGSFKDTAHKVASAVEIFNKNPSEQNRLCLQSTVDSLDLKEVNALTIKLEKLEAERQRIDLKHNQFMHREPSENDTT